LSNFNAVNTIDSKEFGKRIATFRKAQGLSQADLAKLSGIPITAIRRCEQQGSIPLDRYLVLASVLKANLTITPPPAISPQPYESIRQVIRSAQLKKKAAPTPIAVRKPRLGGIFGEMSPETQRA